MTQIFFFKMKDNRLNKIRLNRFIALCGICSRRKADEMISQGLVNVNKTTISKAYGKKL